MIHYVLFAETNSLFHTPIQNYDNNPKYIIEDLTRASGSIDRIIASGSAVTSSLNAQTYDDSGPSQAIPNKIPAIVGNGFSVGDKCYIKHPNGNGEQFIIGGIQIQDFILAEQPLMDEYPSLSDVTVIEISAVFPDATASNKSFLEEERPLRVVWDYSINGTQQKVQEQVRIVRYDKTDMNMSEAIRLIRMGFSDITERMPTGTTLNDWLEFSLDDLQTSLLARGIDPKDVLFGKQATQALVWRTLCHAAENGSAPGNMDPKEYLINCEKRLSAVWDGMFTGLPGAETGNLNKVTDSVSSSRSKLSRSPFSGL